MPDVFSGHRFTQTVVVLEPVLAGFSAKWTIYEHRFTVFTVNTVFVHLSSLSTLRKTDPLRRFTVFLLGNVHNDVDSL